MSFPMMVKAATQIANRCSGGYVEELHTEQSERNIPFRVFRTTVGKSTGKRLKL